MIQKKWTEEETKFLINNHGSLSTNDIAEYLGRSKDSVAGKIKLLRLSSVNSKVKYWTTEEDQFLVENYPTKGSSFCSTALNRTKYSVQQRANRLNIKSSISSYTSESIMQEWFLNNLDIQPLEPFTSTKVKILLKHDCGYVWKANISNVKTSRKKGILGCPKCNIKKQYSKVAIEWLDSFNNVNIQHAENGGEVVIAGFKVDGYDPTTNTVYEFHGDIYHGNLDLFEPGARCNPFNLNYTAEELWEKTYNKMNELSKVAQVIYIWENDYRKGSSYEIF